VEAKNGQRHETGAIRATVVGHSLGKKKHFQTTEIKKRGTGNPQQKRFLSTHQRSIVATLAKEAGGGPRQLQGTQLFGGKNGGEAKGEGKNGRQGEELREGQMGGSLMLES